MGRAKSIMVSVRTNNEKARIFPGRGKLRLAISLFVLVALASCALAQDTSQDYSQKKADYWYKRGLESTSSGNFNEAIQSFSKAIQMDPENAAIWNGNAIALGALYFSKRDPNSYNESLKAYNRAIELYNKTLQSNPQDVNTWYYKGLALSDKAALIQAGEGLNITSDKDGVTGYYEEALKAYDQAIKINPAYLTAWKNKGNVLYTLAEYNESIQAYDQAIGIDKKYALAWYGKGLALTKLGDYDEAVNAYDSAIENAPDNPAIWYNKGIALSSQGKYDAAIRCYDQAIKLNQSFVEAWNGKGVAYEALGFETEANAAFARARYLADNT
jgi:tetratricopeptide (TPR) repeat protein